MKPCESVIQGMFCLLLWPKAPKIYLALLRPLSSESSVASKIIMAWKEWGKESLLLFLPGLRLWRPKSVWPRCPPQGAVRWGLAEVHLSPTCPPPTVKSTADQRVPLPPTMDVSNAHKHMIHSLFLGSRRGTNCTVTLLGVLVSLALAHIPNTCPPSTVLSSALITKEESASRFINCSFLHLYDRSNPWFMLLIC